MVCSKTRIGTGRSARETSAVEHHLAGAERGFCSMTATYRHGSPEFGPAKAVRRDSENGRAWSRTGSNRIEATLRGMWLSDEVIAAEIAQLEQGGRPASIARLRDALRDRYGHASGTDRLRRLLAKRPSPSQGRAGSQSAAITAVASGSARELIEQVRGLLQQAASAEIEALVAQLVERAERAEEREQVHQDRWATEIDTLRQQLRVATRSLPASTGHSPAEWAALENALMTARETISALRQQLATSR